MSDLKLDFKKHKGLLDKILAGNVILFTGAGFSLTAKVRKNPIPTTGVLIDKIIEELLEETDLETIKRIHLRKSFQQICQMAINKVTEEQFNNFLVRTFRNTNPSDFHYHYASINWKEIYTLNIDDLMETVYRDTDIELQVYNTHLKPNNYTGDNILNYYKLHGDVNNKSEGFVFASNQYLNKLMIKDYAYNYTQFAERLYHDNICMIGTNLNEIDLDVYIEKFGKGMGSQIPKDKLYYINRTIYKEDISELERKNVICIEETAESFIEKVIEYAESKKIDIVKNEKRKPIKIVKKISFAEKVHNLGFKIENSLSSLFTDKAMSTHKGIKFYTGFEPQWIDIITDADAVLDNTEEAINKINNNDTFNLLLLVGKSGNGKTTSLKRIIYNYSLNSDYTVLTHNVEVEINDNIAVKLADTFNKLRKRIILVFDDGSWALNFISYLYQYIDEDTSITILVSSRIPEYYKEMRNIGNIPNDIINFDHMLSKRNAERIILKLEEKSYIGELAKFNTLEKKINYFIKNSKESQNDLFSCLIQSVKGDGYYNKLNDLIKSNMQKKENALFLIVLSIFDGFGSFPLPLQLFFNIFQGKITNLKQTVSECSDLLNHNEVKDYDNLHYHVRPRGSFVTKKILSTYKTYFKQSDIFDITKEILIYISSNYNINHNKGKTLYTETTHALLISKLYYKTFNIKDRLIFDEFYHSLSPYFSNTSDFWLQYAKMEMKLKDLPSAKIHLEQASALAPNSYKIKHTIGQWHMFNSCEMSTYKEALAEFIIGEEIMSEQFKINDAYPVHSYIDGYMLLHKKFNFDLESDKIKNLYTLIKTSLEKFDNHALLLIIWKKFYNFLKRNNKLNFIKISLEELQLIDKIDINKDADEQYKI
jgi:ABC-type dipeptide/oligopeptide/nickel transport system ATPase subunit